MACSASVAAQEAAEVPPSAVKALAPGQKIAGYDALRFEQPYIIQRLTERAYFLAVETNNLTFYVGHEGVLVFDPLSGRRAAIAPSGHRYGDGFASHRTDVFAQSFGPHRRSVGFRGGGQEERGQPADHRLPSDLG